MKIRDAWQNHREMSPLEYRRTIADLGLNQSSAARYVNVSPRTGRRFISGDAVVPVAVVLLLRACLAYAVKPIAPKRTRFKT